jgi:putative FmdB family regulatory protein
MPIYEYQCLSCGQRTEILQRMAEAPLATCPKCGGEVKKLVSAPAFQFKGSGWYVTDYAGKKGGGGKSESTGDSGGEKAGAEKAGGEKASGEKAGGEKAADKSTEAKAAPSGGSSGSE